MVTSSRASLSHSSTPSTCAVRQSTSLSPNRADTSSLNCYSSPQCYDEDDDGSPRLLSRHHWFYLFDLIVSSPDLSTLYLPVSILGSDEISLVFPLVPDAENPELMVQKTYDFGGTPFRRVASMMPKSHPDCQLKAKCPN